MRIIIAIVFLSLFFSGCNDHIDNIEEPTPDSETMTYLSKMYPNKNFELIEKDESYISFYSDEVKTTIEEISRDIFHVKVDDDEFYIKYNFDDGNIQEIMDGDSLLKFNEDGQPTIQILDADYLNDSSYKNDVTIPFDYYFDGCTTSNVLDCISAHCEDAGAILCTGCILSKYCLTALTAYCAVDVQFELENPLYCD